MGIEGGEGYLLTQVFGSENEDIPLPDEFEEERNQAVSETLNTLGIIESKEISVGDILRKHFGILDGKVRDLNQISRELNLTRKRVTDIEDVAFSKLRHPSRSANLSLYAPLPQMSLGRILWSLDFGCQISKLLAPLDLRKLTPPDIYPADYLKVESPGQMVNWDKYSYLPLIVVLRTNIDEVPRIFDGLKDVLKDVLESLR